MTGSPDVLVVGAGPTGLALALQAARHGASVRVVDRRGDPVRRSRAMIVHPRTLEVLRPLGVTDALLDRADTAPGARLHLGGRVVQVRLADLALPGTAFPHLTLVRQADVEAVLAAALREAGVAVGWGTGLGALAAGAGGVTAVLHGAVGESRLDCGAVAGCDGADSTVRRLTGTGWPGAPYRTEAVLADVHLAGDLVAGGPAPDGATIGVGRAGLVFLFALGEGAPWRLLATRQVPGRPLPAGADGPPVAPAELQRLLDAAGLPARVTDVTWSARVGLQRRIARRWRTGRVFLAGDAAHVSSPAGGQGMNLGLQDAADLGWKLAQAPASSAPELLLGSYQRERRPVAAATLALTTGLFWFEAGGHPLAGAVRGALAPRVAPVVPWLAGRQRLVAEGVRLLGGLRTGYRGSPVCRWGSVRPAGGPHPGDRLPDAPVVRGGRPERLHALLARPGVHVLLDRDADPLPPAPPGARVTVHRLDSSAGTGVLGVRPDGYTGFRSGLVDDELTDWLGVVGAGGAPPG
ncbi:FAD-dependent monooxygenase [Modestobacter sp. NPDC049651]|uniref:FAD-dependent monooxygenase n=1 Tax=unclassified Modestobacter TaxID=2643866 RepID=UPI0033F808A4